jgi:preprotein translocase subunit SecG
MLWVINLKNNYKNLILIILFVFVLGISINVSAAGTPSCTQVIRPDIIDAFNNYVYVPIKWLTPVALLFFTSFDFAGVVFGGKKENMDKAKNNFLKRSVAALIIFFAPDVINLIISFINQQSLASCLNQFK